MSTSYIDIPGDLVPLGLVHLMDAERIEWLMNEIESQWRTQKLTLWGYRDRVQLRPKIIKYEPGVELNWIASEPRQGHDLLESIRLGHYCEVAADYAVEGRYPGSISRRGLGSDHVGIDLEIAYEDLERVVFKDDPAMLDQLVVWGVPQTRAAAPPEAPVEPRTGVAGRPAGQKKKRGQYLNEAFEGIVKSKLDAGEISNPPTSFQSERLCKHIYKIEAETPGTFPALPERWDSLDKALPKIVVKIAKQHNKQR